MSDNEFDLLDVGTEKTAAKKVGKEKDKERRFDIIIDEVEGLPGYEFVGVNGEGFQIKRGEPVSVPARVVEALKNAVTTAYRKVPHPTEPGKHQLIPYQKSTIPWRLA